MIGGAELMFPRPQLPRCHAAMKRSCIDVFDPIDCEAALDFCDTQTGSAFWATGKQMCVVNQDSAELNPHAGRNVYDVSKVKNTVIAQPVVLKMTTKL